MEETNKKKLRDSRQMLWIYLRKRAKNLLYFTQMC